MISCAVVGGADNAHLSPAIPITPAQIASEALAARAAGAAMVHIHVRDLVTARPTRELKLYREVVERIRDAGSDVIINLTTGPGAVYVPDRQKPWLGGEGTELTTPEDRVEHVLELKPEICSLDVSTMNWGAHAMVNVTDHIVEMARLVRAVGTKPELEVFDLGHVRLAAHLARQGAFETPPFFQFCLAIPWGAAPTPEAIIAMRSELPPGAIWSAFGVSRHEFPVAAMAVSMGGHVRVGLEDNLYISRGVLASGNAQLVENAATLIGITGGSVSTPDQAREILGLKPRRG
jgi:uncharacterized protein (DUF849 family)